MTVYELKLLRPKSLDLCSASEVVTVRHPSTATRGQPRSPQLEKAAWSDRDPNNKPPCVLGARASRVGA